MVVAVIGTVAMMAVPQYMDAIAEARVAKAIGDIAAIGRDVQLYWIDDGVFPDSLAQVGWDDYPDPYGRQYEHLRIGGVPLTLEEGPLGLPVPNAALAKMRLDRFQVPVNSDFDLYSPGKDGLSLALMTDPVSLDDIVRANNGGFIGLAEDF